MEKLRNQGAHRINLIPSHMIAALNTVPIKDYRASASAKRHRSAPMMAIYQHGASPCRSMPQLRS
jgi:hypothetical protein